MSTSIQTGPLIGVQKGPLFVIGKKRPESDARKPLLMRSASPEGALRGVCFLDQARFLKRQLSLPVSMISQ